MLCVCRGMVQVGWIFQLFFVFLGSSAAIFGRSLESLGPRFAGVMSACCWGLGYVLASVAVKIHSLPLLYIGSGVIGGIGLGLGYISPVSTLMKVSRRGVSAMYDPYLPHAVAVLAACCVSCHPLSGSRIGEAWRQAWPSAGSAAVQSSASQSAHAACSPR